MNTPETKPEAQGAETAQPQLETAPAPAPQADTPPKRRRGRPKGSKTKKAPPETAIPGSTGKKATPAPKAAKGAPRVDASSMGRQIVGLHLAAATITGIPELQLGDNEGEMLAGALQGIAEEYGLALDGKTGAAIQLAGVCAAIYLPRYVHLKRRIAAAQGLQASQPMQPPAAAPSAPPEPAQAPAQAIPIQGAGHVAAE